MINISADHTDEETLKINGVQIYPPRNQLPEPIFAPQVQSEVSFVDFKSANDKEDKSESPFKSLRLGYNAVVRTISDPAVSDSSEVMMLEFTVLRIEDKHVDGADVIKATFFKSPEGELFVSRVEVVPQPAETAHQCDSLPLLCRLRAIIANKVVPKFKNALRGCHKFRLHMRPAGMMHHHQPHHQLAHVPHRLKVSHKQPVAHHDKPVLLEQAPHMTYEPHRHHFMHTLRRVLIHVLVPIFVGIAAGMTASLVGMVVGQLIVLLWRRFFRSKRQYANVPQGVESVEQENAEEKGLLEEDLPVYRDVESVTDEKE